MTTSDYLLGFMVKQEEFRLQMLDSIPDSTPRAVRELIHVCLTVEPARRPSFKDACQQLRALLHVNEQEGTLALIEEQPAADVNYVELAPRATSPTALESRM